uniref:Uncharacterized protein n=1 Tax=Vibrio cholerae non-O1/non-O139 TaxID=156539 RepID=A0A220ISY9_VIBCL|nr:hypothetical protein [Vibrio cholerae non-O1/non-O139]
MWTNRKARKRRLLRAAICLFRLRRPPTPADSFLSGFRYALVAFLN